MKIQQINLDQQWVSWNFSVTCAYLHIFMILLSSSSALFSGSNFLTKLYIQILNHAYIELCCEIQLFSNLINIRI